MMKKLTYFFASLIIVALMVSCSKEANNDDNAMLKGKPTFEIGESSPVTAVTPYIIPGVNNGGNRTCAEVASYFSVLTESPVQFDLCDWKRNYNYVDTNGDGIKDTYEWDGLFPDGLDVTVEGIYVSFTAEGCILIDDKYYKVGAVIIKGATAANVYYYPDGTLSDEGLAAPGEQPMVSNLTFCFIECEEQPQLVIAFKSYLDNGDWTVTSGGPGEIDFVAYYYFAPDYIGNKIYGSDYSTVVGNIIVSNVDDDDEWEVTVDNSGQTDRLFTDAYLFVGTLEDYNASYYTGFPYQRLDPILPTSSITFDLPF